MITDYATISILLNYTNNVLHEIGNLRFQDK